MTTRIGPVTLTLDLSWPWRQTLGLSVLGLTNAVAVCAACLAVWP